LNNEISIIVEFAKGERKSRGDFGSGGGRGGKFRLKVSNVDPSVSWQVRKYLLFLGLYIYIFNCIDF